MIAKFFSRGTGSASGIDYLLSERDHEGKEREQEPEVLRGNPELTKSIIDASEYAKKYTSGVLSFEERELKSETLGKIMDGFEKTLMPGLEKSQYDVLWVKHQDKGSLELHFVIPNVELSTGKRLQPYYHGVDLRRVNNWKIVTNYEHGLSDPDAPARVRTQAISQDAPRSRQQEAKRVKAEMEQRYITGEIRSRGDVVNVLTEMGYRVRGKKTLSIKREGWKKAIRLKGALYEQDVGPFESMERSIRGAQEDYERRTTERISRASAELRAQIERRSRENRIKYPARSVEIGRGKAQEPEIERSRGHAFVSDRSGNYNLGEHESGVKRDHKVREREESRALPDRRTDREEGGVSSPSKQERARDRAPDFAQRQVSDSANGVQRGMGVQGGAVREVREVGDDRGRKTASRDIEVNGESVRRANRAARSLGRASSSLNQVLRRFQRADSALNRSLRYGGQVFGGIKARIFGHEEELEQDREYSLKIEM